MACLLLKKITAKGLSRLHGQRCRPDAGDELVLISFMIKGETQKGDLQAQCAAFMFEANMFTEKHKEMCGGHERASAGHL